MKRKTRHSFKRVIGALLCAAMLITGISFEHPTTVDAAAKTESFKNKGTITMKPGDVKRLTLTDRSGKDIVERYSWRVSDKNIVNVDVDLIDEFTGYDMCIEITAITTGTVTLTGSPKYNDLPISMTINVTRPKMTAKQKACKHKWKVTKKATCQRTGIKTCTKCKLQKDVKKTKHAYTTTTVYTTENEGYYHVYECSGCACTEKCKDPFNCPTICPFQARVKYDKYGNIAPDSEYKSEDDAYNAWDNHRLEMDFYLINGVYVPKPYEDLIGRGHSCWHDFYRDIGEHAVEKIVTKCKYCGKEK